VHGNVPLPAILGWEAAGVVEAIGPEVVGLRVGDRVAYVARHAYATARTISARHLVLLPPTVSDEEAAAAFVRGLTVEYLVRRLYKVAPGDVVLVHAAAGGVGIILSQWAKLLGAAVIGIVGTEEKAVVYCVRAQGL
jgi:NADPH2:quinone reductase